VVIEAPPGAGKTTRVPPALLRFGGVAVLEPRRLAARLASRRVAGEMGETLGETVGYQVRFEDVSSPRTRLRFLTEGVLTRRLISDPDLRDVATVVLDEFHERHLDGDLALALLRRLQRTTRPDLRLAVMSATLDGAAVAAYLGGCPVVRSEGRLFPVETAYTPHSSAALEDQVAAAVGRLAPLNGDVLVFLPGAAEIRRAMRTCEPLAARLGARVAPLSGDLSPEEQDIAVNPLSDGRRKIILSTNVAESSVTIEGVTAVIDSGLARIAKDSPWTGISSLEVSRVGKHSANQRAGRAGRTAPGRVIRLYPAEDFHRRPDAEAPQIARRELAGLMMDLAALGVKPEELDWFEAPPAASLTAARAMLDRLGAWDRVREMARIPAHPRIATLVLAGGRAAVPLAAALASGDRADSADALDLTHNQHPNTRRLANRLRRLAPADAALDLPRALLRAFPDRVARRHNLRELLLCGGGSAVLPDHAHALAKHEFFVAIDVEERRERGAPLVRLAAAIEPEMLLELFPDRVTERSGVEWNRAAERVESVQALLYDGLTIDESRSGAVDPVAAEMLAAKAREAGIERFTDPEALEQLLARCEFAARHADGALPPLDPEHALVLVCTGLRSFAELKQADFAAALRGQLTPAQARVLEQLAPERWRLPSGRQVRVQYSRGKDPWLESRLQDFFGMHESPRVAGGKVPLVLHLLAPNQRPVQTTTDLAGFWVKWYPQIRKELMRRYPRHAWPESPS